MFKQTGVTTLEALLSISIMASISGYTLSLAEEVEVQAEAYRQQINIQDIRDKIYSKPPHK